MVSDPKTAEKAFKQTRDVVVALDIVSFTSFDPKQQKYLIYIFNEILTEVIRSIGVGYHKIVAGDAAIFIFDLAQDDVDDVHEKSVQFMIEVKKAVGNYNASSTADDPELKIRYGAHLGNNYMIAAKDNVVDVLDIDRDNFFGKTVNAAWRLMTTAEPDTILITKKLYDELEEVASTHLAFFYPVGKIVLKGVKEVDAYIYSEKEEDAFVPGKFLISSQHGEKEIELLRDISSIVSSVVKECTGKHHCHRTSLLLPVDGWFYAVCRIEEFNIIPAKVKCIPIERGLPGRAYAEMSSYSIFDLPVLGARNKFGKYIQDLNKKIVTEAYHFKDTDEDYSYFGRHCRGYVSLPLLKFDREASCLGIVSVDFLNVVTEDEALQYKVHFYIQAKTVPALVDLANHVDKRSDFLISNFKIKQ
ncbi:MAG: adenylate/guanylate cyclase domain-containing protein [Desulfovibrionaceae bacterium]